MMGASRQPNSRDIEIGRDLARNRKAAGISQANLAAALGIFTQQVGKYERGENRISTSRHEQALKILRGSAGADQPGLAEERAAYDAPFPLKGELLETLRSLERNLKNCIDIVSKM